MTTELLGLQELAARLGITYQAVRSRRTQGRLPDPDYILSGNPIWKSTTIDKWVRTEKRYAFLAAWENSENTVE